MVVRGLIGLLIGLALGSVVGAVSFLLLDILFPTPAFAFDYPSTEALILLNMITGFIFFGLPSAVIGAIVGGFKLNKYYSGAIGAIFGLLLILISHLYLLQEGENIFFEEHQTGLTSMQGLSLLFRLMFLFGLAMIALIVSVIFTIQDEQKLLNKSLNARQNS